MSSITKIRKGIVISLIMPLIIFLRLIKPLVRVRFVGFSQEGVGCIYSFYRYFEEKSWDYLPKKESLLDLVIVLGPSMSGTSIIQNKFFVKLEKRVCFSMRFWWFSHKFAHKFFYYLYDFKKIFGDEWVIPLGVPSKNVFFSVKYPPLFHFSSKEVNTGEKSLEKFFGYKNDMPIATFSNRDDAFYKHYSAMDFDLRHSNRNSSIESFHDAITKMSEKYFCFRMGKIVFEPLGIEKENVIDYPNSKFKSDFLDFYIFAKAKFYIGDDSGINYIPYAFRRKMGIINCPVFTVYCEPSYKFYSHPLNNSVITKKYYSIEKDRLLNLSELLSLFVKNCEFDAFSGGKMSFAYDWVYEELGIKVIGNTPKEILDLTLEVEKRANDDWEEDYEHFKREDEVWKIFGAPYKSQDRFLFPRIGFNFLKENEWLLQ